MVPTVCPPVAVAVTVVLSHPVIVVPAGTVALKVVPVLGEHNCCLSAKILPAIRDALTDTK